MQVQMMMAYRGMEIGILFPTVYKICDVNNAQISYYMKIYIKQSTSEVDYYADFSRSPTGIFSREKIDISVQFTTSSVTSSISWTTYVEYAQASDSQRNNYDAWKFSLTPLGCLVHSIILTEGKNLNLFAIAEYPDILNKHDGFAGNIQISIKMVGPLNDAIIGIIGPYEFNTNIDNNNLKRYILKLFFPFLRSVESYEKKNKCITNIIDNIYAINYDGNPY